MKRRLASVVVVVEVVASMDTTTVAVDMVLRVTVVDMVVVEVRQGFGKGRSQGTHDSVARQHAGHHETRHQENQWHLLRKNTQSP
ncbi:hypothetical protein JHK84_049132 [Glycine max]|nr:hypothetical protein JHK86_049092 [Glycine max]KAG4923347.1 hypothetical protein JHK87_048887 [Glycine soja]KAG5093544.1 hypothetical protein JHK84_049132 [Glycine max]